MRHGRISDLIRRSAGALLLLGSLGVSSDILTKAEDANCATPAPACTPQCSDDVYKRAGDRLAQQLQQMGSQPCGQCATSCGNGGTAACNSGCDSGCVEKSCLFGNLFAHGNGCEEPMKDAWSLTDVFTDECGQNHLKDNQWSVGGSTVQSFTANFSSPSDGFNGPVTWTDQSNKYQLNQQWLYLNRATKVTDEKDWDIGGRVDLLYGTNTRFTTSSQFEDKWNATGYLYGLSMPSAYVELAYKKTVTKVGRFISPVGYNTIDLTLNPFNTIPYSYQYGQPFTHTGIWTQWQATDKLSIGGALIHGWDNTGNGNPNGGFMGTATYNFDANRALAFVNFWTQEPSAAAGFTGRYLQTVVYSHKFAEKFMYVGETDFASQNNATASGRTARWYSIIQYLYYSPSERLTWSIGGEWFRDEEGVRVGGFVPTLPNSPRGLSPAIGGFAGNFFQLTMGPRYQFNKNMYIRPNLRFDYYDGPNSSVTAGALPFGAGTDRGQCILGTDFGITY